MFTPEYIPPDTSFLIQEIATIMHESLNHNEENITQVREMLISKYNASPSITEAQLLDQIQKDRKVIRAIEQNPDVIYRLNPTWAEHVFASLEVIEDIYGEDDDLIDHIENLEYHIQITQAANRVTTLN